MNKEKENVNIYLLLIGTIFGSLIGMFLGTILNNLIF